MPVTTSAYPLTRRINAGRSSVRTSREQGIHPFAAVSDGQQRAREPTPYVNKASRPRYVTGRPDVCEDTAEDGTDTGKPDNAEKQAQDEATDEWVSRVLDGPRHLRHRASDPRGSGRVGVVEVVVGHDRTERNDQEHERYSERLRRHSTEQ